MNIDWKDIAGHFEFKPFYDFLLSRLKPGSSMVEVGVLCGKSIAYLAQRSKSEQLGLNLWGVDIFVSHPEWGFVLGEWANRPSFYDLYKSNLVQAGVDDVIKTLAMTSVEAAKFFKDGTLDCVFIDAVHDTESVTADILAWRPKVKPGGILSGDDYIAPWGVIKAVDELVPNRNIMGQTWWVEI